MACTTLLCRNTFRQTHQGKAAWRLRERTGLGWYYVHTQLAAAQHFNDCQVAPPHTAVRACALHERTPTSTHGHTFQYW